MTMKKAKRRMIARKGKMIRTMMTRERDSLNSSNLHRGRTVRKMPPTSSTTSCRTRSSTHCEQIIHLDTIKMEIVLIPTFSGKDLRNCPKFAFRPPGKAVLQTCCYKLLWLSILSVLQIWLYNRSTLLSRPTKARGCSSITMIIHLFIH